MPVAGWNATFIGGGNPCMRLVRMTMAPDNTQQHSLPDEYPLPRICQIRPEMPIFIGMNADNKYHRNKQTAFIFLIIRVICG